MDGKELFYREGDVLVAVPVRTLPDFSAIGPAERLSPLLGEGSNYDVSAGGRRFVVAEPVDPESPPLIRVTQNWFTEFRDR